MPEEPAPTPAEGSGFLDRASARIAAAFPQSDTPIAPAAPAAPVEPPPVETPVAPTTPVVDPPAATKPAIEKIEPEIDPPKDELGLPLAKLDDKPAAEEPPAEGEEDPNEPQDPKARRAFKTLRTELAAANTTLATVSQERDLFKTQLEEFKATNPDVPALQAKVEEYEKILSVTRLQSSPAYIKAVEEPYQAVVTRADEIAEQYELDKLELSKALAIPDRKERSKALSAILTGVAEDDKLDVYDLGREVEKIAAKEKDLLANADKALKELEAEAENAKKQELAQRVTERKATVAKVIPYMAGKLPTFRTAIEGLTETLSDTDLSSLSTTAQVYNAAAGELMPVIIKQLNQVQRDLEAALEENEKFRRATPGGGAGGGPVVDPPAPGEKEGFQDRVAKRLKAAGMA